ncbi:FGGY family carbohydrate kinase [Coraliomargarita sp. W4R72]
MSNAGHTLFYNIATNAWDDELLKLFKIPAMLLPQIRNDSEAYGSVARGRTLAGTPITIMTASAQAERS